VIYHDAQLTYGVVLPQIDRLAREVRPVVPGIATGDDAERALDFELGAGMRPSGAWAHAGGDAGSSS
jgi:hypothetical protein